MLFNSYPFLLVFLPLALIGFHGLSRLGPRFAGGWLAFASLAFYSYWNIHFLALPACPTIAETVPGYEASVSFGLFAPAGTPTDVIRTVNADVQKIVDDAEFEKKYLEPFAVQPLPGPLDGFAEYLRKDAAKWDRIINAANVKIE